MTAQDDRVPDEPVDRGQPVRTGQPRVDAVLDRLDTLAQTPLEAHPDVFESVHRDLQQTLSGLDEDDH